MVGGQEADPNSIPWQVGLVRRNGRRTFCGGTIICDKFVMTAAHCVGPNSPNQTQVLAGEHNLLDDLDKATRHDIKNVIIHPDYQLENRQVK